MTAGPDDTRRPRRGTINALLVGAFAVLSLLTLLQSYTNRILAENQNKQLVTRLDTSTEQSGKLINQVEALGKKPVVTKEQIPEKVQVQGPQGIQGIRGPQGDKGDKGDPGDSPPCLIQANHCVGAQGIQGIQGLPGKNGLNGKDGIDGKDGLPGKDGADGKDGVDGKNGLDGKDGTNGQDGKDGVDGTDGKDGLPGPACPAGSTLQKQQVATTENPAGVWVQVCVLDDQNP